MTFSDAVNTMPDAIRLWVLWLTIAMIVTPLILLIFRQTRRDGVVVALSSVAVIVSMQALYAQVGFVRLLGLPHVLIWTPLAIYLALRLWRAPLPRAAQAVIGVFLASIAVSLVFDYIDVVRYIAGDRAPMTEAAT